MVKLILTTFLLCLSQLSAASGVPVVDFDGSYTIATKRIDLKAGQIIQLESIKKNCTYIGTSEVEEVRQSWIFFEEITKISIRIQRKICGNAEIAISQHELIYIDSPVKKGEKIWIPIDGLIHSIEGYVKTLQLQTVWRGVGTVRGKVSGE